MAGLTDLLFIISISPNPNDLVLTWKEFYLHLKQVLHFHFLTYCQAQVQVPGQVPGHTCQEAKK